VARSGDGREALRYLWSSPSPAAVVLDLFLPTMNGWQLHAELKADVTLAHIPVIVVTAAGEHWGYPVPPAMLVRKPVDPGRLIRILHTAINGTSTDPT
jgi:CheY-like chemotaxis protein